ncbi:ATPase AAA [Desulfosarcina ovata subsp. sediminis]|uniref:ATPase AAA n=1 Tax=Desulfosarcina ovata subsp. sediminis TaxID=885957 RepID=A0A5K7ZTG9_9BACT|nr:ExeA family protein [Desulfosarcina ovata]BBO83492.1 ATPase AAA [Desulfosarcina ovata subsp. sediminis]
MYNRFFGFKERPFKLVPNPAYLYLSRVHEEVLAHLNYAIGYGEGFVEITGEVGTGKTTLCRMFLENLDADTEAAYIFNPKLDALQLLKAVNDEFGIDSDAGSTKQLIDRLNAFLLDKKTQGKRVILLIDEAQNLSADVLEQLRLLSNLETTTSKLLQIILVGQPELGALLETDALRQLNQRITLSCHLIPLSTAETREYIRHRLHIASPKPGLAFSAAAYRSIFKYTGGVPRLINIACDRALLTAFTQGKHRITNAIVKTAIRELDSSRSRSKPPRFRREGLITSLLVVLLLLMAGLVASQIVFNGANFFSMPAVVHHKIDTPPAVTSPAVAQAKPPARIAPQPVQAPPEIPVPVESPPALPPETPIETLPVAEPTPLAVQPFAEVVTGMDPVASRTRSLRAILEKWGAPQPLQSGALIASDNQTFFRISAAHSGLQVLRVTGHFDLIRKLNLPAIVTLVPEDHRPRFMALVHIDSESLQLSDGEAIHTVPADALDGLWSGVAHIFWKNFHNYQGIIPDTASGEAILALKVHLKSTGFAIAEMTPAYDVTTRAAVEAIQHRNGLVVDGKVGSQTKIILYNEDPSLNPPHLTDSPAGDGN